MNVRCRLRMLLVSVLLSGTTSAQSFSQTSIHRVKRSTMTETTPSKPASITFTRPTKATVKISVANQPFTTLDFGSHAKPIFYPIQNPAGTPMTRNFPMRDDVAGEEHDHPHHKSLWFAHEVNGADFWHETTGRIEVRSVEVDETKQQICWAGDWLERESGNQVCQDSTTVTFSSDKDAFAIRYEVSIIASASDITFEDTKEGSFALRVHPHLRLQAKPEVGIDKVFGSALNSNGETNLDVWSKRAKWVLYSGTIEGKPAAIAVFDHPNNLRHPTTWHARDYGLFSANPFGLHDFEGKPQGDGKFTVAAGERLTQTYQATFFRGIPTAEQVESRWAEFAK